jgi:hypothetical protein
VAQTAQASFELRFTCKAVAAFSLIFLTHFF